jgi:hypothetical protein
MRKQGWQRYAVLMRCIGGSLHQYTVEAVSSYHAACLVEETFPDKLVARVALVDGRKNR